MGTEEQTRKLKLYVADITINLWGKHRLQKWGTQMTTPAIPGTENEEIRVDMVTAPGESIDRENREQSQAVPSVQTQDMTGLSFQIYKWGH